MSPQKATQLKRFIINSSIGPSAVRNQGKGIINPIREKLIESFSFKIFFNKLYSKNENDFKKYLNDLTDQVEGLPGMDEDGNLTGYNVRWGTARKCINLVLRSVVYSGHVWEGYDIGDALFTIHSKMQRLELPLDNNVVDGLKTRLSRINHDEYNANAFRNFTISHLTPPSSQLLQGQANALSQLLEICKIDLDLILWRPEVE